MTCVIVTLTAKVISNAPEIQILALISRFESLPSSLVIEIIQSSLSHWNPAQARPIQLIFPILENGHLNKLIQTYAFKKYLLYSVALLQFNLRSCEIELQAACQT